MALAVASLGSGFREPVQDSQRAFKAAMTALSRPGLVVALSDRPDAPQSLPPAMAALALALADPDAPVWLDAALATDPAVAAFLRFHAGCPVVPDAEKAAFALIGDGAAAPDFASFAQGSLDYPDRSATLILAVSGFGDGRAYVARGPGVDGSATIHIAGGPADLAARMAANRSGFPRGVDVLLVAGDRILGLPRSVALAEV